jgi:predicted metal-dependent hydrolase
MIAYTHKTHPRSKSIKISIKPSGEVVVTTPRFTPKWSINAVVKKSDDWIQKQLLKINQQKNFGETPDKIKVFGKTHLKKELDISSTKEVERFLKSTATRYILPRTKQLADKMEIKFGRITLRQQKTRWGSCSSQGNLNFNWRLVHCPAKVIDYVIIHELAHRQHMNHSSSFWDLVRKYDPEYLKNRGWLKRNGLVLG